MFEFLRVASLDNQNADARKEAYWIIVYIYLKKNQGIDISESLVNEQSSKVSQMLKDVDLRQFTFEQGFLECNNKKVSVFEF